MIETDVNLGPLNTLAVDAKAQYLAHVHDLDELREALAFARDRGLPLLPLGGGSNLVFTDDFPGLVIHLDNRGVDYQESGDSTLVSAAAGENWHQLVMETIGHGYGGLENLALIPGRIGAAPIQNIGAYGVELRDSFESLEAVEIATGELKTFTAEDCRFCYRDSVFKGPLRDQYIITRVTLRLDRNWTPKLDYPALQQYFIEHSLELAAATPRMVADAVIAVRNSKLPDPAVVPNVGSFFKNPVVDVATYERLRDEHPDLVAYPFGERWKLAAGWLIDQAGWKGYRDNNVGVHERQALVLVNPGCGAGPEVTALAAKIAADIQHRFGVTLDPEPRFYP